MTNSALNAAPYSLNGQTALKPSSGSGRFGFNVGGPLRIPKLITSDKYLLYVNYTGQRARTGNSLTSSVPTLAERNGDFSQAMTTTAVTIYDPLSGAPFPGNAIPVARFNPAAAGLLAYFPLPTYPGIVQNYHLATSTPRVSDSLGVRFNAPLTTKDRLNFNEQYNRNDSKSQQLFGYKDSTSGYGLSASAGWSHSFKPRFNNSLNITFSRNISKLAPYFAYTDNVAAALGITGTSQDPINYGPPSLSFTNFGSLSDGSASVSRNQTTNITDSITYVVRRKHNLTFGVGYRRLQQNSLSYANSRGSFSFSGLLTSQIDSHGQPVAGTGFDFADFLLGLPQTSSLRLGSENNYFRGWAANWYAQDDWRVRPGLSFNVGLRYEYFAPVHGAARAPGEPGPQPAEERGGGGDAGQQCGALLGQLSLQPDRPGQEQLLAAAGLRVAAFAEARARDPRRLQHFLQRLVVRRVRVQYGGAAAVCDERVAHHQHRGSTDAAERIPVAAVRDHHQHLRHRQELQAGLCADVELRAAANLLARAAGGAGIHRHQRHGAGDYGAAQPGGAGLVAAQCAAATANRQRHRVFLPDLAGEFHFPRRTGTHHAPIRAGSIGQRAVHVLEIHRRRFEFWRGGGVVAQNPRICAWSAACRASTSGTI